MNAPDFSIKRALDLHRQGQLGPAASVYQEILAGDPRQFDALHLLGVLAYQIGSLQNSILLIEEALRIQPSSVDALINLGNSLKGCKRFGEALACYERAIEIQFESEQSHFNRAVCLQDMGRLNDAIEGYSGVVERNPNFVLGWLNLGVALEVAHRYDEALTCMEKVISLQPHNPLGYSNRGNLRKISGYTNLAISDYREALNLDPKHTATHYNLGVALQSEKRFEEAKEAYLRVIDLNSEFADARINLGVVCKELGLIDEALAHYSAAVSSCGTSGLQSAWAWTNRGHALREKNDLEAAIQSYRRALENEPECLPAINGLGNAYRELKDLDKALTSYEHALTLDPKYVEAWVNKGAVLRDLGRLNDALESLNFAISLNPNIPAAFSNLGLVLDSMNRPADALAAFERALTLQPDYPEALSNRGNVLRDLGQIDEAMASHELATSLKPQMAAGQWNKALALLTMGRYREGWPLYEWGWETRERGIRREFSYPLWLGEAPLAGRTILLHSEQGLGDALQFCRFVPEVATLGARVILEVPKVLRGVLQGLAGVSQWVIRGEALPQADFHCPLMSLPLALKTELHSIPQSSGYLAADSKRVSKWKATLEPGFFHIGVCWQGSQRGQKVGNAFPLASLQKLSRLPGVKLYSLQKGDGTDQLASLPSGMRVIELGPDFDAQQPFTDTAALMKCLDLVITTDTSVAHLAGALGVRTWVALRFVPDWRWLLGRQDCPWYDSMRLFRQSKTGDWQSVFNAMNEELSVELAQKTNPEAINVPHVPVSWGEVLDKITILEIKQHKISDPAALTHVNKEHGYLWQIACRCLDDEGVRDNFDHLKAINEALWVVEDRLRELESSQSFDDEFIQQARSVYRLNDERARLKRCINDLTGSALREEKSYWQQAA